jgi:hypothetical protein
MLILVSIAQRSLETLDMAFESSDVGGSLIVLISHLSGLRSLTICNISTEDTAQHSIADARALVLPCLEDLSWLGGDNETWLGLLSRSHFPALLSLELSMTIRQGQVALLAHFFRRHSRIRCLGLDVNVDCLRALLKLPGITASTLSISKFAPIAPSILDALPDSVTCFVLNAEVNVEFVNEPAKTVLGILSALESGSAPKTMVELRLSPGFRWSPPRGVADIPGQDAFHAAVLRYASSLARRGISVTDQDLRIAPVDYPSAD